MRKILLLILTVFVSFTSCDKKDIPTIDKGKLDPNATILIKPAKGAQLKASISGLTALDIVEQTMGMTFQSHYGGSTYYEEKMTLDRGFGDNQRDFDIPALKMFGTDIIQTDGSFIKEFIYGTDVYLVTERWDTIGYIPQNVIDNARVLIEAAYNDDNYTEVYKLFNEAFTFMPISE